MRGAYRVIIDFEAEGHGLAKKIAHIVTADAQVTIQAFGGTDSDFDPTLKFYTADGRWSILRIPQ